MFISIAFVIIVLVFGLSLLKPQKNEQRHQLICIIAICVGLWSLFAFAIPGMSELYKYLNQGHIDSLQSEIPKEGPYVLPPMSFSDFLRTSFLSIFGVLGAFVYLCLAITSTLRGKIFFRSTCLAIGWNALMWTLHITIYHYFIPLPTLAQNIMVCVVWGLPFVVCFAFNLFWLYWINKQTNCSSSL